MARPLLRALRDAFPDSSLQGVAPASLLDLLAPEGVLDGMLSWSRDGGVRTRTLAAARAWRPDAAVVLPPSLSSAWFAWRSRAERRVGYASEARSWLLSTALVRPARGAMHLSHEYLALGAVLGASTHPSLVPLPVPEYARDRAATALEREGLARPLAIIAPGAMYGPAKRWGADRFAELAAALRDQGRSVVLCGTQAERDLCDSIAKRVGAGCVSFAGRTSLSELAGLCAVASIAVSNDSGLAHLSAAIGAPTVVVFGSTSSAWTAPLGPHVRVVQNAPVCSPCFQRTCRIGYTCLRSIEVTRVRKACEEIAA